MRKSIALVVLAGLSILSVACTAQEADPITVLKSDASLEQKAEACRVLSYKGGPDCVPILAPMLTDEKLSHIARYALEGMPFPEAGAALRDALGKTAGKLRVGVISSLGIRKDEQAVPALIALLADTDASVAQAAAGSLAAIATPEAVKGIEEAVAQAGLPPNNLLPFCDALGGCAEKLAAKGDRDRAAALYERMANVQNAPAQVYAAALRGLVLVRGAEQGLPLLLEALRGEDVKRFEAALRVAREMGRDDGVTLALAGLLPALPPERKLPFLDLLGERGGMAAGPAAMTEAKDGPVEVRAAAIRALTRMGYTPALALMEQLASGEDAELAKVARNSLSYFPGQEADAALQAMVDNADPAIRRAAIELIGGGGLDNPVPLLAKAAKTDADESVRVAALKALKDRGGIGEMDFLLAILLEGRSAPEMQAAESALGSLCERQKRMPGAVSVQKAIYGVLPDGPLADVTDKVKALVDSGMPSIVASNDLAGDPAPGRVKALRVEYLENEIPLSKTVSEGETLKLTVASAPASIVDAYCSAFDKAQGMAKLAALRLLGITGSPKALAIVRAAATADDEAIKETALRTLCAWPSADALDAVMELAKTSPDATIKVLALRGAVRLLGQSNATAAELHAHCEALLSYAGSADEKKTVLGGLAEVSSPDALALVLAQLGDESVKAEATQAAIAIAKSLGRSARDDTAFFNGKDLSGWQGNEKYWRCEDGAIVGHSSEPIPRNEFLWSNIEVRDFYLALDVKLEPNTANAGIQFRSKRIDEYGQALGYQADVGQDVWGRLYHEHGRGKLDWTDRAEKAVKPGDWNRYEILAVGPVIWTAINGTPGVAFLDPDGERSGLIAVQIHGGPPQTVHYRINKLVHDPKIRMEGLSADRLIAAFVPIPGGAAAEK
ncbi:MAG TPA: HEAT repeat domain-containing protein [Candidatus Hydrogenedentes bacterium]|nr:HEAT repeat domain-containing protein [Candidatus Hydrogenedentota bacterium]